MARVDIQQSDVLQQIVAHLRNTLELPPRRCYEVLEPLAPPLVSASGDYFLTIAPGAGQFVTDEQVGPNFTEEWSIIVTIYTHIHLDSVEQEHQLLVDATRGILGLKKLVLAAMVGADLNTPAASGGESSDVFLRQLIHAISCDRPQYDGQKKLSWMSMTFGVSFDWDLD
jgi:hypothetical protein